MLLDRARFLMLVTGTMVTMALMLTATAGVVVAGPGKKPATTGWQDAFGTNKVDPGAGAAIPAVARA